MILPVDIRKSCVIQAEPYGSVMTVPRENRLVRFYIHLKKELFEASPQELVEVAERAMKPYKLTFKHCDWWSLYHVRHIHMLINYSIVRANKMEDRTAFSQAIQTA